MIQIGQNAPHFTMTNQDGKSVNLSDYSGKYILMWWYPKASTPGWTIEGKGFRDRIQDYQAKNCVILGVSFDTPNDNKSFKDEFDFPYDLLTDQDREASRIFGASDTDTGKVKRMSVLISPYGKILRVYETVTPLEHPDQVLSDLAEL